MSSSWPVGWVVGLSCAGALACGPAPGPGALPTESYVDVPITLDDVRSRADPPTVEVSVEEGEQQARSMGGGGCHDPACLVILLPIWAVHAGAETVAPQHYQVATIRENGVENYSALFGHDGAFLRATARAGDEMRFIGPIELPVLGRRIVVEIGRASIGPDGALGQMRASPIQGQVDLRSKYDELLASTDDPSRRADAVVEAVGVMGADAAAFARARLVDQAEQPEVRARVASAVCSSPLPLDARTKGELVDALAAAEPPLVAGLAAMSCYETGTDPAALPLARALAAATCARVDSGSGEEAGQIEASAMLFSWLSSAQPTGGAGRLRPPGSAPEQDRVRASLRVELAGCPAGPARDALAFLLREPVGRAGLSVVFADPRRAGLLFDVDLGSPDESAALLDALGAIPRPSYELARALAHVQAPPDAAELTGLAEIYLRVGPPPAPAGSEKDAPMDLQNEIRAHLLARMGARLDDVRSGAAVETLRAAADDAGEHEPALRVALAVLGEKAEQRRALAALMRQHCSEKRGACQLLRGPPRTTPTLGSSSPVALVEWGLSLAGCSESELNAAAAQDGDGPLCGGPRRRFAPPEDAFRYR